MNPLRWFLRRKVELAIFLLGVLLRLSMVWNYHFTWDYDYEPHWQLVQWILDHGMVPNVESTFESFHPPLFYATAAWLVQHGFTRETLVWFSIACGVIRLGTIWAGLELYVVSSRCARVMALALAAVVSASVHLDGMAYAEALTCLLNAVVMLLLPLAFRRSGKFRWPLTLAIGFILGLAMLTKVSTITVLAAIGAAIIAEFFLSRKVLPVRLLNVLPWAGMFAVCLGVCGWYYARTMRQYGTPFITSFDLPSQSGYVAEAKRRPLLDRRTLGFLCGWDARIYESPYRPTGLGPNARFFPVAIASSVVDYWRYGFVGYEHPMPGVPHGNKRAIASVLNVSQLAAVGGTVIFFSAIAAWFVGIRRVLQYNDMGRLSLLLVPFFMLLGALHFAISNPNDDYGVIKGVYMTVAAPPLYALFGVAAGWAGRKVIRWPLLGVLVISLWFVAAYSVQCRLGFRILPLHGL